MNDSKTRLDQINTRIRNYPVLSLLIVLGTLMTGLSTFTNATRNLLDLLSRTEPRPAINGRWQADVGYDWPNAQYRENFDFAGSDEDLYGSASFTGGKSGILEGKVSGDTIRFITKTTETLGNSRPVLEAVHRYRGKIAGDEIKFAMQTEGGLSAHVPVEFIARRNASPRTDHDTSTNR